MEDNNYQNEQNIYGQVEQEPIYVSINSFPDLQEAATSAKRYVYIIFGMVALGFLSYIGVILFIIFFSQPSTISNSAGSVFLSILIVTIVITIPLYLITYFLYRPLLQFSNRVESLINTHNSEDLEMALIELKKFYKYMGIAMIVCFVLGFVLLLIFIIGIVLAVQQFH